MGTIRRILYYGNPYKDFGIYLALVLNNLGYHVMITDKSPGQELRCFFDEEPCKGMMTYRNVDFYIPPAGDGKHDIRETHGDSEVQDGSDDRKERNSVHYDYGLDYINEWREQENIALEKGSYDMVIFNMDGAKMSLRLLEKIGIQGEIRKFLVLRDLPMEFPKLWFLKKYYLNSGLFESVYGILIDLYDKEYQYRMEYEGIHGCRYLSAGYSDVIVRLTKDISGQDIRRIKKALRCVKEGRIFDNRLLE